MFFNHQMFFMFASLDVAWDAHPGSLLRNAILASIRKIQINFVCVFCPSDVFHFSSCGRRFGIASRVFAAKM